MNEFLIELQAKLDEAKSKGLINSDIASLQGLLDKLKLQVELDPNTAQKLADDIGKLINQKITISNINIDTNQAVRNAKQTGQQIGRQIQDGINSVIQKGNFKTEFTFSSGKQNSIVQDEVIKEFKDLSNGIISVKEQMSQVNGKSFLDGFIVNIKKATGEVESLTYRLKDMLDSQGKATGDKSFQYVSGTINDNGVIKQLDVISAKADSLQTKLDKLKANYSDINSSRPIKDTNNISALSQQYDKVSQAIENVRNANNTTFSSMVSNAQREITVLDSMVAQFRNAENVATQMKSVDISSGIAQAQERLGKLKADSTGFEQMTQTLRELDTAITNVGDKSSLDAFIDKLRVAETQLSRVKAETKSMSQVNEIQLSMDNGHGVSEYQNRINSIIASLERYGIETKEAQNITASLQSTFDSMKGMSEQSLISQADKLEQEFKAVKASVEQAKLSYDKLMQPVPDEKVLTLLIRIQRFLEKNTNITKEAKSELTSYIQELNGKNISLARWNQINAELKKTESTMGGLGRLGKSFGEQIKEVGKNVTSYLSVSSAFMTLFSKTKESISELKNLNSILTEISKTSNLTEQQLKSLGSSAFNAASKYGKTASDYLTGVQEMYRAGFNNAEQMSELSILAQAAGDMDATTANDYLIASDAAYNLKGNIEELNKVLDGQNLITNNAAVSMLDMAQATSEAASIASQYGVEINELSSLIAVATSKTRESGSETGTALKALFVNLQDTTSKPIKEAFDAVNISMTEMVNGSEKLKTPIQLLKELSEAFVSLDDGDVRRANILSDIGGKHHANTLSAILSDWSSYEKMLDLYSKGVGSAAEEAEKSSKNWEGSMNRLSNTWTSTVNNIANSDAIIAGINSLNGVISVIDKLTNSLGSLGTIGLGAGIFAGAKNIGKIVQVYKFQIICFMF